MASGYFYAIIAILGGSSASVVVKAALGDTHAAPLGLLSMRLLLAAPLLWVVMLLVFRQRPTFERRLLIGALAAGIANSISLSCFYVALTYIDASVSMVIYSTNPLFVLAILWFLGTTPRRIDGFRALLAIIGVILLVGVGGQAMAWQGVALVAVTAVVFGVHLVIIQKLLKGYSTFQVTPLIVTVMAVCVSVVYFISTPSSAWLDFSSESWIAIVLTAVVSTVITRLALVEGIQRIGSGQTALLSPVETLLSVIWAALFISERLTPIQLVGGALVLISAALAARRRALP